MDGDSPPSPPPDDVEQLPHRRRPDQQLRRRTLIQALTALNVECFYTTADAEHLALVVRNPAVSAKPPSATTPEHTSWTAEEPSTFLRSIAGSRLGAAFVVLATTGMSRSEVLGLRCQDLDIPV